MIIFDRLQKKYSIFQLTILELILALVVGILVACITQNSYLCNTEYIDAMLLTDFGKLDKLQLFIFILEKRLRGYICIWLFSVTILAIPYNIVIAAWKGFSTGFLFGSLAVLYGLHGVVEGIGLIMPQYVIYVPVFIQTVLLSYKMHKNCENMVTGRKWKLIMNQLPAFLFLLVAMIGGCILEAFLNPILLNWIIGS